jgi:hypothetical protein
VRGNPRGVLGLQRGRLRGLIGGGRALLGHGCQGLAGGARRSCGVYVVAIQRLRVWLGFGACSWSRVRWKGGGTRRLRSLVIEQGRRDAGGCAARVREENGARGRSGGRGKAYNGAGRWGQAVSGSREKEGVVLSWVVVCWTVRAGPERGTEQAGVGCVAWAGA